MYYFLMFILVSFITSIGAYASTKSSETGSIDKWFFINWLSWSLPMWATFTLFTKKEDLLFAGVVYDIIMCLSFSIAVMYFTKAYERFNLYNYIGIIMMVLGILVYKISELK